MKMVTSGIALVGMLLWVFVLTALVIQEYDVYLRKGAPHFEPVVLGIVVLTLFGIMVSSRAILTTQERSTGRNLILTIVSLCLAVPTAIWSLAMLILFLHDEGGG